MKSWPVLVKLLREEQVLGKLLREKQVLRKLLSRKDPRVLLKQSRMKLLERTKQTQVNSQ
jgi:hypothetical protein